MKTTLSILIIIISSISTQVVAENYCGDYSYTGSSGPYDYTNPEHRKAPLPRIELHHFPKKVENLIEGQTGAIGGDISFLLNYYPNHHRALAAMSKLSIREKSNKAIGSRYSTLCFFDRATRFNPKDAMVRSLFGNHLLKIGKFDMALEQLIIASEIEPNNPKFNYNLGLLFFDKKDYIQSKKYAEKAYSQDFPMLGLKNKLKSVGKW